MFRSENAQVQDTVLLGTDKLFPVKEEDRSVAVIQELKKGDGPRRRNLGNTGVSGFQGLVEGVFEECRVQRASGREGESG